MLVWPLISLGEIGKDILVTALGKSDGVRKGTAGLLGITFRSIRYRLSKYGIVVEKELDAE